MEQRVGVQRDECGIGRVISFAVHFSNDRQQTNGRRVSALIRSSDHTRPLLCPSLMRNLFRIPLGHVSITLYSKGKQRRDGGKRATRGKRHRGGVGYIYTHTHCIHHSQTHAAEEWRAWMERTRGILEFPLQKDESGGEDESGEFDDAL